MDANVTAIYKPIPQLADREELAPAREALEDLFNKFEADAVAFVDEAWYRELTRLMKDAISECKVGTHGLGKYAILKLRDTAWNWYKLESGTKVKKIARMTL